MKRGRMGGMLSVGDRIRHGEGCVVERGGPGNGGMQACIFRKFIARLRNGKGLRMAKI